MKILYPLWFIFWFIIHQIIAALLIVPHIMIGNTSVAKAEWDDLVDNFDG